MHATDAKTKERPQSTKPPGMVRLNLRVPAPVFAQLFRDAERRSEDVSATARRHLAAGLSRDENGGRFEALERKLDVLLANDPAAQLSASETQMEALTTAALDMERRLTESLTAQAGIKADLRKIMKAYSEIVNILNKDRDD